MKPQSAAGTALLGILGIAAAVGIALAADSISGEEIGLSSEPVSIADEAHDPAVAPVRPERRGRDERGATSALELGVDDEGTAVSGGADGGGGSGSGSNSGSSGISGSGGSGSGGSPTSGSGSAIYP